MVTEIAAASAELLKLINNTANQTLQQRIDKAQTHATQDVELFKQALLAGALDRINLQLNGLQHGILVRLTETESRQLGLIRPDIDAATLLALYARGRSADLAAECSQICSIATASASSSPNSV